MHPVLSPDENRFAFVCHSSGHPGTVWIAPAVRGAPIRLTQEYLLSPGWSPDAKPLAA
jgi:Tol biopolymer transport system component